MEGETEDTRNRSGEGARTLELALELQLQVGSPVSLPTGNYHWVVPRASVPQMKPNKMKLLGVPMSCGTPTYHSG